MLFAREKKFDLKLILTGVKSNVYWHLWCSAKIPSDPISFTSDRTVSKIEAKSSKPKKVEILS